jgi:eukaryotic-like serine/threonine-protein kinase
MPLQVGDIIADYEILEVLGQGGMGTVFRVRNRLSHRQEAMKQVLPQVESNLDAADRFLREIRIQASLQHPHIAALHTAMHLKEGVFMVMELINGQSVEAMLRRGPLPLSQAVRIADDILSALIYAHARGIVHRDLKPANILVNSRGMPKLTDFGIARAADKEMITRSGMAIGSLHYMSPEQVMSKTADERSDVYSLGVTLYEMLTGTRPFDGESEYAIMNAHLSHMPAPPSAIVASIPQEFSGVVLKSMAKAPEQRYQTATAFQTALREAVLGGEPTRTMPAPLDPAEMARVEASLREILGPIAKSLISKESRQCSTLSDLCRRLAEQIPNDRDRARFLKTADSGSAAAPASPSGKESPIDEASIAAARKALTLYLGPIAGVVTARAARGARSVEDLRATLAREIPDQRDRQAFLDSFSR